MDSDCRKTTGKALLERRKLLIHLWETNQIKHTYTAVAKAIGISRQTAAKWIKEWQTGGIKALDPKKRGRATGTQRRLTAAQEKEVQKLLIDKCPEQLKLDFALWDRNAVSVLIRNRYGIKMPVRTMGLYLARWHFTPQKPIRRAYARNEKKVAEWLEETYPAIVKRAQREDAEINWGDETGIRSDNVVGRSYAPCGKTPIQHVKGKPEKINMISAITNRGKVRFMFYREMMNAGLLKRFMTRLIQSADRKIFLILDNLRVHHSRELVAWLESHKQEIELFYLPSYSPDLNPDEHMNSDLKSALSKKPDSRTKGRMEQNARSHMKKVQKNHHHIQRFFDDPNIQYASMAAEKRVVA